ncbi:hypothetical protein MMC26_005171 [Xylographa opegraphella]|nr:hypothetical protein [Xylographa opegraphella]
MSQSANEDKYYLKRDYTAATRLNAQQYLWQQELRFNLHPDIPALEDGARIADVAAGTGVWLLEVAHYLPNVQCDGFDISLAQCPPKKWLPANITFSAWNMFDEPPENMVGIYDVVHLRHVILVIDQGDPVPAVKNLAKLLKPNGYLQWDEIDLSRTTVKAVDNSVKVEAMTKMDILMKGRGTQNWILNLPETLNGNGFHDAKLHRFAPQDAWLKLQTDIHMLSWTEINSNMPDGDARKAELAEMIADVYDESKQGAAHGVDKLVFVARKSA